MAAGLAACGKKGSPLPPLPRAPAAVRGLEATLAGSVLELAWTTLPPPAEGQTRVMHEILWEVAAAGEAGSPAQVIERLRQSGRRAEGPGGDWSAAGRRERRLEARVEVGEVAPGSALRAIVLARTGRHSTPSDPVALAPPQEPLPAPRGMEAIAEPEGVRLRWPPIPAGARLELFRSEAGSADGPALLARLDPAAGEFLDRSARLGAEYRYAARLRVPAGERAWAAGPAAEAGPVAYIDAFAPASPRGLALLMEGGGARLLWSPNREPDLAGYRIYRRIGDAEEEPLASVRGWEVTWLDSAVPEGESVAYRLTAFDASPRANESAPSEPVGGVVRRPRPLAPPQESPATRPAGEAQP